MAILVLAVLGRSMVSVLVDLFLFDLSQCVRVMYVRPRGVVGYRGSRGGKCSYRVCLVRLVCEFVGEFLK